MPSQSLLDVPCQDIIDPIYCVPLKSPLKKKTYEELLNGIINNNNNKTDENSNNNPASSNENKTVAPQIDKKDKSNTSIKGELKKMGIKNPVVEVIKEEVEYEINEAQYLGEHIKNQKNADITPDFKSPSYKGDIHFVYEKLIVNSQNKLFNKFNEYKIVKGVAISWLQTNLIEIHQIQSISQENIPSFLLISKQLECNEEASVKLSDIRKKQETQSKPENNQKNEKIDKNEKTDKLDKNEKLEKSDNFEKKITKTFQTLYPISCSASNSSSSFLATGLIDGSVLIFDLFLCYERCYLDKHLGAVSFMRFFEEWNLISAAYDNSIHFYDLQTEKMTLNRTNIFQGKSEILGLEVAAGLGVALDEQGNARVYDVIHNEKVKYFIKHIN
jgi:hypothetical protein